MWVRKTKTLKDRCFKVVNTVNVQAADIIRMYDGIARTSWKRDAFMIGYRNGKHTGQRLEKHTLGKHGIQIATFLQLPDPHTYTGHCLRRTAATLLANKGTSNMQMREVGGWKSMTTVNGYIAENDTMRRDTAEKMLTAHTSKPSTSAPSATTVRPDS